MRPAPDSIEAIWAYRVFSVTTDGQLRSPFWLWPRRTIQPGVNRASCNLGRSLYTAVERGYHHPAGAEVPSERCSCGFYAYHCLEQAIAEIDSEEMVVALVKLWGLCQAYRAGLRGQYLEVVALAGSGRRARRAAERYGLPLSDSHRLSDYQRGPGLAPELWPDEDAPVEALPRRLALRQTTFALLTAAPLGLGLALDSPWPALPALILPLWLGASTVYRSRGYKQID